MSYDDAQKPTDMPPPPERTVQEQASDIKLTQVARRYDNARTALAAVALIVATSCLLIIITLLLRINDLTEQSRERGIENQRVIKSTNQTAQTIEDCTTPGGQCFQRSQANTGEAVGTINDITIAANLCTKRPEVRTVPDMRACIRGLVKR